jgi:hypothetical protein
MVNTALVYQTKFRKNLHEAYVHLARIDEALDELGKKYRFPIAQEQFADLLTNRGELAFADQIVYRFSKAQDTIGAKLFKAFLLYQGENVDCPFLDILNELENCILLMWKSSLFYARFVTILPIIMKITKIRQDTF